MTARSTYRMKWQGVPAVGMSLGQPLAYSRSDMIWDSEPAGVNRCPRCCTTYVVRLYSASVPSVTRAFGGSAPATGSRVEFWGHPLVGLRKLATANRIG